MIRPFAILICIGAASVLIAAPVPKEVKKEDRFEGTWQIESVNAFGRVVQFNGANNQHWTLDAEGNMKSHQGPAVPDGAKSFIQLAFDPKLKTVEYKYTNGNNINYPGVYELVGDSLKVCCNLRGTGTRPANTDPAMDSYIWTLKRVKPEDKK